MRGCCRGWDLNGKQWSGSEISTLLREFGADLAGCVMGAMHVVTKTGRLAEGGLETCSAYFYVLFNVF